MCTESEQAPAVNYVNEYNQQVAETIENNAIRENSTYVA